MIVDAVDGVSVTISVDGQGLREYNDSSDANPPQVATCYVESVPGKAFTLDLKLTPRFLWSEHGLSLRVDSDGRYVDKQSLPLDSVAKRGLKAPINGRIELVKDQWVRKQLEVAEHTTCELHCHTF